MCFELIWLAKLNNCLKKEYQSNVGKVKETIVVM